MRAAAAGLAVPLVLVSLAAPAAARAAPAQTRAHAQIHLLRIVARNWAARRMPGLIDPRTHALVDNTQAVCHGGGRTLPGPVFTRFVCVVRPLRRHGREGLYVSYRAVAGGGCECHWLVYRRR